MGVENSPGFLVFWRDQKMPLVISTWMISVPISQMGKLVKEKPEVETLSSVDTK